MWSPLTDIRQEQVSIPTVAWQLHELQIRYRLPIFHSNDAPVAQLDSASVFGTEGWGFESLRAYFFKAN